MYTGRYASSRPCSAACRYGSPVPPHQRSVFGLAASDAICASASPVGFLVCSTRMPVAFANSRAAASHHGWSVLQIAVTVCAAAEHATNAALAAATRIATRHSTRIACSLFSRAALLNDRDAVTREREPDLGARLQRRLDIGPDDEDRAELGV